MRINSKFFVLFMALLTILLCFLMLWLWRRLSRRGPAAILGRTVLLVSSQLAMTATILAGVNIYFGFYTSWHDLFGGGTQGYQLHVQPPPPVGRVNAAQLPNAGATQTLTVATPQTLHGLRSGISANVTVFVPSGYQDPAQQRTDYPAIVIDETGPDLGPLPKSLAYGKPATDIAALLIYVDTGSQPAIPCTDLAGAAGQQGALFWDQDLRTAIAAHYRVGLGPENWAVVGLNRTAACAGTLAVLSSGYYGAAATFGPWTEAPDSQDPAAAAVNPEQWLKLYPGPPSSLLLVDADAQTKAVFSGGVGGLQVTTQRTYTLQQMLTWLVQALNQSSAQEGPAQWA